MIETKDCAIKMIHEGKFDEKIIFVPFGDPSYNSVKSIEETYKIIAESIKNYKI